MRIILVVKGGLVVSCYTDEPDELRGQVSVMDDDAPHKVCGGCDGTGKQGKRRCTICQGIGLEGDDDVELLREIKDNELVDVFELEDLEARLKTGRPT